MKSNSIDNKTNDQVLRRVRRGAYACGLSGGVFAWLELNALASSGDAGFFDALVRNWGIPAVIFPVIAFAVFILNRTFVVWWWQKRRMGPMFGMLAALLTVLISSGLIGFAAGFYERWKYAEDGFASAFSLIVSCLFYAPIYMGFATLFGLPVILLVGWIYGIRSTRFSRESTDGAAAAPSH